MKLMDAFDLMLEGKSIRTVIRTDFPLVLPRPVQMGFLILSPGSRPGD